MLCSLESAYDADDLLFGIGKKEGTEHTESQLVRYKYSSTKMEGNYRLIIDITLFRHDCIS